MRVTVHEVWLALLLTGAATGCHDYLVGEDFDAGSAAVFAIAYVDTEDVREDSVAWRINPTVGLVIDVGPTGAGLDLAGLRVVAVTDDSPRVDVSFTIEGAPGYVLPPGFAGGRLTSGRKWIDPLVPEPRFDDRAPSLQVRIDYLDPVPHTFAATVHASVVVELGGEQATLPFEIRIRSTGAFGGEIVHARRVLSRTPSP